MRIPTVREIAHQADPRYRVKSIAGDLLVILVVIIFMVLLYITGLDLVWRHSLIVYSQADIMQVDAPVTEVLSE